MNNLNVSNHLNLLNKRYFFKKIKKFYQNYKKSKKVYDDYIKKEIEFLNRHRIRHNYYLYDQADLTRERYRKKHFSWQKQFDDPNHKYNDSEYIFTSRSAYNQWSRKHNQHNEMNSGFYQFKSRDQKFYEQQQQYRRQQQAYFDYWQQQQQQAYDYNVNDQQDSNNTGRRGRRRSNRRTGENYSHSYQPQNNSSQVHHALNTLKLSNSKPIQKYKKKK